MNANPTIPAEPDAGSGRIRNEDLARRQPSNTGVLDRLLDATVEVLRESGFAGLTVRLVARQAGVSAATAYNYVSSKEHLLASLFWRELSALPRPVAGDDSTASARVGHLVSGISALVQAEPELSPAYRVALLADDPDTSRVRDAIAKHLMGEFSWALGKELSDDDRESVQLAFIGGMTLAGTGLISHHSVALRVAGLVDRLGSISAATVD
jgi:AcrR family transcriptional regulator